MTAAQQGIWFAQAVDVSNPVFSTGQYLLITGSLDVAAFSGAVATAMQESDGLRVQALEMDGEPVLVARAAPVGLVIADVSLAADPLSEAMDAITADMATPIDLAHDALAVQCLYVLGDHRYVWYQRIHHLVIDGYGTAILSARIFELYRAAIDPSMPAGKSLAAVHGVEFADAEYATSERRDQDRAFWHAEFRGVEGAAGFKPGASSSSHGYLHQPFVLNDGTALAVHALAAEANATWPDVLVAFVGAYVQRLVGANDCVLGVPTMNRLGTPAARVPAMVMNVLPVRVVVNEDAPTVDLVRAVALRLRAARKHGRYRAEQLRRDLGLIGGERRLFGPMVNVMPFDTQPTLPGAACELTLLGTGPVDDITFNFRGDPAGARLQFDIDANPALYSASEVGAHGQRFAAFLTAALHKRTLAECATVTRDEGQELVAAFNNTARSVRDVTLTALIDEAMLRWTGRKAVTLDGRSLTYEQLDTASARVADRLGASGITRNSIVAVSLPRSLELVIVLVGILRAGAAYLPLDVSYPIERVRRIFESASPAMVVVSDVRAEWDELRVSVIAVDQLLQPSDTDYELARATVRPDDAAYVIYTSGSTGTPKGVVIEHRAIVNRLEWMRTHYGFDFNDHVLHKTPTTFDVSVWELFLPLVVGAELVLAPADAHRDPAEIAALVRTHAITAMHFVPSMLDAFLDEPAARGLVIPRVFCSGEELRAGQRDRFHRTVRGELHNLYGPTEAAVDVTYWEASRTDASDPIPIGRPVWNTQMYVLDARMRLLPLGVAGKLYIGGVQLAREYLGQPELTAARFVPDPFGAPGARLYDTGDLARWRDDGAIEFLGRADFQVKIRGQRVELGEIESAIRLHASVASVCVLLREDRAGDQRLVAYVVPAPEASVDVAALRAALGAQLPAYMIPAAWVSMAELPLTSSGKLDRKALPRPSVDALTVGSASLSFTERAVASAFAETLQVGVDAVGTESDFFGLGGHSLLAVRVVARLRREFDVSLSLGSMFAHPTVARMATHIEALQLSRGVASQGLEPMLALSRGRAATRLFCIHPAGGISWCYAALARSLGDEFTVLGVQAHGVDVQAELPASLSAMASAYVAQIQHEQAEGPYHLAGWSVGGIIAHEMAHQLRELGADVGVVALLDSYPSDHWRDSPEPPDGAAIKALLLIAGIDPAATAQVMSQRDAVDMLRDINHPLGALSDDALAGVVRVVANNNALVRAHHQARFDGRLVHFRAALDHAGENLFPSQWGAYSSALETHDIQSLHAFMVSPAASATVAGILRPMLRASMTARVAASPEPSVI